MKTMRALNVNFANSSPRTSLLGLFLFAAGGLAIGMVSIDYLDAKAELDRLQTRQARVQLPSVTPRRSASSAATPRDETQATSRVLSQLRSPWDAALREIEAVNSPSVALLNIEISGKSSTLRLTGEAKAMSDVVTYVSRLRGSPQVDTVHLSHHEEKLAGTVKVVRFLVDATLKAPS